MFQKFNYSPDSYTYIHIWVWEDPYTEFILWEVKQMKACVDWTPFSGVGENGRMVEGAKLLETR